MNESVLEVIITEHNAVVLLYLRIQNGEKKHVWLPSCGFDNSNGYVTGRRGRITINLFLWERIRNRRM